MTKTIWILMGGLAFAGSAYAGENDPVTDSSSAHVYAHSTGCERSTATATTIVNGKKVTKTITSEGDCQGGKGSSGSSSSSSSASASSSARSTSDE